TCLEGHRPGRLRQKRRRYRGRRVGQGHHDRGGADRGELGAGNPATRCAGCLGPLRGAQQGGQLVHRAPEQGGTSENQDRLVRGELAAWPRGEVWGRGGCRPALALGCGYAAAIPSPPTAPGTGMLPIWVSVPPATENSSTMPLPPVCTYRNWPSGV